MNTSKFDSVALHLHGEPATEIFLIDGAMTLIARGVESLDHTVPPGLYKVRSRKGEFLQDRLIEVKGDSASQTEQAPVIPTRSSAPLANTATSHKFQSSPARELSKRTHVTAGTGSALFVYIRDEQAAPNRAADCWHLPPESVSIHHLDGRFVADLSKGEMDGSAGYSGINAQLDPGTWRVRIETEPLGTYELFVTTVQGWQSQVFLTLSDFFYADQTTRRPALREALVLMSRLGRGFNPDGQEQADASLTVTALAHERSLLPGNTMDSLIYGKVEDPLLGVYALHVLLLEKKQHPYDLPVILTHLTERLGETHPDLQALRCQIDPGSMPRDLIFEAPPLLYRSWQLMIRAGRQNNGRIPQTGIVSELAENILSIKPWLIHRLQSGETSPSPAPVSLASAERIIKNLLELSPHEVKAIIGEQAHPDRQSMSDLEVQILQNTIRQSAVDELTRSQSAAADNRSVLARHLVQNLQAPGYSIARAAGRLADRFNIPSS